MERGIAKGKAEGILQLLGDPGDIPTDLENRILSERDPDTLNIWLKSAARAESIRQFRDATQI